MKYAFIALIACYLLVYGCGPDKDKKAEEKKGQTTVQSTVSTPQQPATQSAKTDKPKGLSKQPVFAQTEAAQPGTQPGKTTMPKELAKQPVFAQPEAQQPGSQPAVTAKPQGLSKQPVYVQADQAQSAAQPSQTANPQGLSKQPVYVQPDTPPPPPQNASKAANDQPQPGDMAQAPRHPCPMMTDENEADEAMDQVDEEDLLTLPCGHVLMRSQIPAGAPCLGMQAPPCLKMGQQPDDGQDTILLPCGRVIARPPMPPVDAPHPPQHITAPGQVQAQPQVVEEEKEDLTLAVQRMVETTNDMVLVTRQLVLATQEMLKATKGAAVEQVSQPNRQGAGPATDTKTAGIEQNVVDAMNDAVIASQKAVEAANQAVSKAVEPKRP